MRPLIGALLSLTLVLGGLLIWEDLARAAATSGTNGPATSAASIHVGPQETGIAPMPWTWWVGLIAVGVSLFDLIMVSGHTEATPMAEAASPGIRIAGLGPYPPVGAGHRGPRRLLPDRAGLDRAGDRMGQPAARATG